MESQEKQPTMGLDSATHLSQPHKIAIEPWEVGGELLDILSRGLYTDARDAIREYVQNGIDAGATTVTITANGPLVLVRDNGDGMDWETLRRARRFGISDKSPRLMVGYRGIGLYASFGMCETLSITTRQSDMKELLHLKMQFGPMRRILEQARLAEKRIGVAIADLLYEYTEFSGQPYNGDPEDHFTLVRLEGVTPEYRSQLTDANALTSYILNTVPVALPNLDYGSVVNEWLREHVILNPIRVTLRVENEPEIEVQPLLADDVGKPEYKLIKDVKGRRLAFVWDCLSDRGERISSSGEGTGTSGFLLKIKGFTLGDRTLLAPLWPPVGGRTLYHHYTGEVHVLEEANVYPNAARDDIELSPWRQTLFRYLEDYFADLNRKADLSRDIIKTKRNMEGIRGSLARMQARQGDPNEDPYELYRVSKNLLETLDKTERDLLRLMRGRASVKPTSTQQQQLEALTTEIKEVRQKVSSVAQSTGRRTEASEPKARTANGEVQPPPQAALLATALKAVQAMQKDIPSQELARAVESISSAAKIATATKAVAALDGIKAIGIPLSPEAEAARKELRTLLGWSPVAPVSLGEALSEEGFSPVTPREQALVISIDMGLLSGMGGRGQRYEAVLRAIAEAVADEQELQ